MDLREIKKQTGKKILHEFLVDFAMSAAFTALVYYETRSVNLGIAIFYLFLSNFTTNRRFDTFSEYRKAVRDNEAQLVELAELLKSEQRHRLARLRPESQT